DEIGDMPQATQVKLLRALQEGEIKRVGDGRAMKVNVRLVAATNKNLQTLLENGKFRQDLYYRINVIHIHLPPLKERLDDIEPLVKHFIHKYNHRLKRHIKDMSPEFMAILKVYPWPGNVRELENIIERAIVVSKQSVLDVRDLPSQMLSTIHPTHL